GSILISRPPLVGKKQIFRNGVRLIPSVGLVLVRTPRHVVIDGFTWQMRNGGFRRALQNRQSIGIACIFIGIDKSEHQLVKAVRREAVFIVKIGGNGFRIKLIQAEHFLAACVGTGDGVVAGQGRDPLPEGRGGGKAGIVLVPVVIRVVVIPAAQVWARGGLSCHLAKRLKQAIFV